MSTTPILGIQEVAQNQNLKEVTINDGFIDLENATQASMNVTFVSNLATLTPAQFTDAVNFKCGTLTAAATLTVPLTPRQFSVDNSQASYSVTVGGTSGATVIINAGSLATIISDGVNLKALQAGASTGVSSVVGNTGSVSLANLVAGGVAPENNPTLTGTVVIPTVTITSNSTIAASTGFVHSFAAPLTNAILTTPSLTADPAPTDSSELIPSTQWVTNRLEAYIQGLNVKEAVRAMSSTNVSLTAPGATMDSVTLASGDRVALIGQTTGADNGIYVWTGASSTLTRAADASVSADMTNGTFFWVSSGATYGGSGWILSTVNPITLGTTSLTFSQFSSGGTFYTFGTGFSVVGSTVNVNFGVVAALASPSFTGTVTAAAIANLNVVGTITALPITSNLSITAGGSLDLNTAAFGVINVLGNVGSITLTELVTGGVAPKVSPILTGTVDASGATVVKVPTVALGDNSTNAASTAFVFGALNNTATGFAIKPTAVVATTAGLPAYTYNNGTGGFGATLTATSVGTLTIDGYLTALGDVILVKNETSTNQPYNGLYTVTTAGAAGAAYVLTRHPEMNTTATFSGAFIAVGNTGSANTNTLWLCENIGVVTVGTTNITFNELSIPGSVGAGTGIAVAGTIVSLATIASLDILANITGGAAAPIPNTLTAVFDACITSNQGAIMTRGASTWGSIAAGTSGYALISNGTSVAASWQAIPLPPVGHGLAINSGTISSAGTLSYSPTAAGTITLVPTSGISDVIVNLPTGGAAMTITATPAFSYQDWRLHLRQGATVSTVAFDATVFNFGASGGPTSYTLTASANAHDMIWQQSPDGTHVLHGAIVQGISY